MKSNFDFHSFDDLDFTSSAQVSSSTAPPLAPTLMTAIEQRQKNRANIFQSGAFKTF